ncbi:MAG TPA: hypothetical protein VHC90_03235 [Bryobacteraceae bacterium]|nr:hypothetical protein [Bryobacteraceae bacterium]
MSTGSLRLLGRAGLLALLAGCIGFAAEKPWALPLDSTRASGWSLADLDGDRVADLANAGPGRREGNRYVHRVQIDLSHTGTASFDIHGASASIRLCLRDIDGDHDRDLVVFEPSSSIPVAVWLNDGAGHFTQGNPASYARAFSRPGPNSLNTDRVVNDTLAAFSGDQLSFHVLPVALTPATAARAPASLASAVLRSAVREAFAPRGPPSLL